MTVAAADWRQRWQSCVADTYGTPAVVLVRGQGARVWDENGREYIDLLAGIAVNALGHAHPAVVEAVSHQLGQLGHTSNLAVTPPAVELAERLLSLLGRPGRVFFSNSGAEANEAAVKLSRLTGRARLVAAENGFHGRTMGALSVTGQKAKREPFEPLIPGVTFVPFGDSEALSAALDEGVAAVLLEPIQGEGGVIPAPPGYLQDAQQLCADSGALLMLDEVQTGVGRTGEWFAHTAHGVMPDVITLAKGLGGGIPIGAMIALGEAAEMWRPGMHGSTFGGNPVSCAAALAVLDTIDEEGLLDHAVRRGELIAGRLSTVPGVAHVRGAGLLRGVVLDEGLDAPSVERRAREHGVLVNAIGSSVLRLAPPLTIEDSQLGTALEVIAQCIVMEGR